MYSNVLLSEKIRRYFWDLYEWNLLTIVSNGVRKLIMKLH